MKFVFIYNYLTLNFYNKKINNQTKFNKHNSIFLVHKFHIINFNIHNNFLNLKLNYKLKKFSKNFFQLSGFFIKYNYKKFMKIFFFFFVNNISLLFISFKHFLYELVNLNSIINDVKIYNILVKLFYVQKNSETRNKFRNILYLIATLYKTQVLFIFDFKYSYYIYKVLKNSNLLISGIAFPSHKPCFFDIPIYFTSTSFFVKLLLINQLNDLY